MNNWMSDIKLYLLNVSALAISFSQIEMILKILLLLVSIIYTGYKFWLLQQKGKDEN